MSPTAALASRPGNLSPQITCVAAAAAVAATS